MSDPAVVPVTAPVTMPASDRRRRELVGVVLWALAALSWVAAMFVPWFRAGVVSSVTPLEVAALLRAGALGVPPAAGYAVLLLPALALLLLGLSPVRGGSAMAARVVLWALGTVTGVLLVLLLGSVSAQTYGWGAGLVGLGCVLGGVALGFATVRVPDRRFP